jgi:hypothetical protein
VADTQAFLLQVVQVRLNGALRQLRRLKLLIIVGKPDNPFYQVTHRSEIGLRRSLGFIRKKLLVLG